MNRLPPHAEDEPPPKSSFWPTAPWVAFAVVVFIVAFIGALLAF